MTVATTLRRATGPLALALLGSLGGGSHAKCLDGRRKPGITVQTWLDEAASCAPVEDGKYTRARGRECPIQHYSSTLDATSIHACARACDGDAGCVGFGWGVPVGAVAPLHPCALSATCNSTSPYLRDAPDGQRASYFKTPVDPSHFAQGIPRATAGAVSQLSPATFTAESMLAGDISPAALIERGLLEHLGDDCWGSCGQQQGPCPQFCGSSGMCCRLGFSDTSNGCDGAIGTHTGGHRCAPPQSLPPPTEQSRVHLVGGDLHAPMSGTYSFELSTARSTNNLLTALTVGRPRSSSGNACDGNQDLINGGDIELLDYSRDLDCRWTVHCDGGDATLRFHTLNVRNNDHVYVYDYHDEGNEALFTGDLRNNLPADVTRSSGMVVRFTSGRLGYDGFSATVTCSNSGSTVLGGVGGGVLRIAIEMPCCFGIFY